MLALAAFFWGTTFVAQAMAGDYQGAYTFCCIRNVIAVFILIPVIKITGNAETYRKMEDNIDFDASRLISGVNTLDELRDELYDMVIECCDGKQTKAESLGINEIAVARMCNFT